MVPKLMLDGMPYELQEITASELDRRSSRACLHLQNNLIKLEMKNKGPVDNGYWISFVEIMDSNGDWFVPTVQYAFHVFQTFDDRGPDGNEIYNMFAIKNIYVRNNKAPGEKGRWKLVNQTHGFGGHSRPIPDDDHVAQSVGKGRYGAQASENSYIWTTVEDIQPFAPLHHRHVNGYVVSEWTDISSFAYRELLLRNIDPEEGELKMLIQVAADTNKFQAAINKEVI